ncbi:MAG TPA: hypothetical protein VMM59_09870 [Thermohalobaculum sp.]|nr:hypothetical protein [Thermohalobaculum sp.]
MTRTIATLAFAAAALAATGALAENTTHEHRQKLAQAWGQPSASENAPTAASVRTNVTGIGERRREHLSGHWADNFRGGRKHPPAGH